MTSKNKGGRPRLTLVDKLQRLISDADEAPSEILTVMLVVAALLSEQLHGQ